MEQTGMDITVTNNYLPCKAAIFPWAPEAICATYVCVYHLEQRTMIMTEGQNNYKPQVTVNSKTRLRFFWNSSTTMGYQSLSPEALSQLQSFWKSLYTIHFHTKTIVAVFYRKVHYKVKTNVQNVNILMKVKKKYSRTSMPVFKK